MLSSDPVLLIPEVIRGFAALKKGENGRSGFSRRSKSYINHNCVDIGLQCKDIIKYSTNKIGRKVIQEEWSI
jgi:hypothetical protein